MEENNKRLIDKTTVPEITAIKKWIGRENYKLWENLRKFIVEKYPDVFQQDDWIYGGKKHGWSLRFKKSKSFCTFIPEKDKFLLMIVFGNEERKKTEEVLSVLSHEVQQLYINAKVYHDGKWVLFEVNNEYILNDIKTLLVIKRKPKV